MFVTRPQLLASHPAMAGFSGYAMQLTKSRRTGERPPSFSISEPSIIRQGDRDDRKEQEEEEKNTGRGILKYANTCSVNVDD